MKKLFAGCVASLMLLGVCHAAPPTIAIPANPDAALTQVTQRDERIVAYFDEDKNLVKAPAAKGTYRKLYGKTAEGHYVVQEFYQDTQTKKHDPFVVTSDKWFTSGEVYEYIQGPVTISEYSPKGRRKITTQVAEDTPLAGESLYPDGQLMMEFWQESVSSPAPSHMVMHFKDGGKLQISRTKDEKVVMNGSYANDKFAFMASENEVTGKDRNGKSLSMEGIQKVLEEFQKKGDQVMEQLQKD